MTPTQLPNVLNDLLLIQKSKSKRIEKKGKEDTLWLEGYQAGMQAGFSYGVEHQLKNDSYMRELIKALEEDINTLKDKLMFYETNI